MVALKIDTFGGMLPAVDDRLLKDRASTYAENLWMFPGTLRGMPQRKYIRDCDLSSCAKVFRIPASYTAPEEYESSTWLEFQNIFTDIVRAPVVDDSFDRYYWTSTSDRPRYNTRYRLDYNFFTRSFTFTATNGTNTINATAHGLVVGDPITLSTTGSLPTGLSTLTTYYVHQDSYTTDSFKLAASPHDAYEADSATVVTFTTDGSGTHTSTTDQHTDFALGVEAPGNITVSESGGSDTAVARAYVITYETAYGEEGPPSNPYSLTDNPDGTWTVTMPSYDEGDVGLDRYYRYINIYRTVSGEYYYVGQADIWDATFDDTETDTDIVSNASLTTDNFQSPPTSLEGWIMMPNGVLAAFQGKELWFSEPYRPHAWPSEYTLAVEYDIVGLGIIQQTLVACTVGFPITATGVLPRSITLSKLATFEPCLSRASIISRPEGVYYTSPNGVILVSPTRAENVTKDIITRDRWREFVTVEASQFVHLQGTTLFAFGTARAGVFDQGAFDVSETAAFEAEDLTPGFNGFLIDVYDERLAFSLLGSTTEYASVQNDVWTGNVFILASNSVYWLDLGDSDGEFEVYTWKSKKFQFEDKQNLSALRVYFEELPSTPNLPGTRDTDLNQTMDDDKWGIVRVYADEVLVMARELRETGELMRIPSGYKADYWQVEINARVRVLNIQMANSVKELGRA